MARYFFNVRNGKSIVDEIGSDLPDLGAVQREAIGTAAELLKTVGPEFWLGQDWTMDVTDTSGDVVFRLYFSILLQTITNWNEFTLDI